MSDIVEPGPLWRRSARCITDNHCVEVAELPGGEMVGLRNSQLPDVALTLSRPVWRDLIAAIKAGHLG
ncbi:hypothetical protein Ade02nite_79170 [Paractinoplanes deccanensis]|uniref:DUF397 domain-containing protein n=1 Tax=Paractinoplanes deccanensis TaxID=113561 RepID=A0ABQ3YGZ4_9ACTN|nr:DUF397 domain-containing protein [Actinoplanes deccanensis]GID79276.1 hypothetical protein Ade02nite_79170 [Actinoplanes deccanensis]